MFTNPITNAELQNEIRNLPVNKAPGLDEINANIVKHSSHYIIEPLSYIYNLSFLTGTVPGDLKLAKIIPIYKKKEISNPGNYRPISLLSIFNKLMEKLMFTRLYSFLSKYQILYQYQFGFREKHSTVQAIIEIADDIKEQLDEGNIVLGTYLDLSKAFDTVNHKIFTKKIKLLWNKGNSK